MDDLVYDNRDFISVEEIWDDFQHYSQLSNTSKHYGGYVENNKILQDIADCVFDVTNTRFSQKHDYSSEYVHFGDLPPEINGQAKLASEKDQKNTEILISSQLKTDRPCVVYTLAHEATHAALYDTSEWLEEMVALDVAYELFELENHPELEKIIYETKKAQTIDALCYKLRDEGFSELKIAHFLKYQCELGLSEIPLYANVQLKDYQFKPFWFRGNKRKIDNLSRYKSQAYFTEKWMNKHNSRPIVEVQGKEITLDLGYLFAHSNDVKGNS